MKRKGGAARDRLKEAWNEIATRRTATGSEADLVGRAGRKSQPTPRAIGPPAQSLITSIPKSSTLSHLIRSGVGAL